MTPRELWSEMWNAKLRRCQGDPSGHAQFAYGDLKWDTLIPHYTGFDHTSIDGKTRPRNDSRTYKAGTTVKIVFVCPPNVFGITPDLNSTNSADVRYILTVPEALLTNLRYTREIQRCNVPNAAA